MFMKLLFRISCAIFLLAIVSLSVSAQIKIRSQVTPTCTSSGNSKFADIYADGNIAVMGSFACRGVWIYDVSNPDAPVLSSWYNPGANQQFLEAIVLGNRGYFGSGNGGGVHIVDLTNPALPTLLGTVNAANGGHNSIHEMMVFDQGGKRFLIENSNSLSNKVIKIFDITNPSAPVQKPDLNPTEPQWIHAMHIRGNRMFTSGWGNTSNRGRTEIYNIANLDTTPPALLGFIEDVTTTTAGNSMHSSWSSEDGNYLYSAREISNSDAVSPGDVRVYDVSNPAVPLLIRKISSNSLGLNASGPHNPVVMGNKLYVSWYQAGVQVFDIGSDPTNPKKIGSYDTWPTQFTGISVEGKKLRNEPWDIVCGSEARMNNLVTGFDGNWAVFPFLGENKVLAGDLAFGLIVLDVSPLNSPPKNTVADFDGDRKSDRSVYSASTGTWTIELSATGGVQQVILGEPGDIPVPGDYNGDGQTEPAVWRPSNGGWYVNNGAGPVLISTSGTTGDMAVPGDYDADGKTDPATWRPTTGNWTLNRSLLGVTSRVLGSAGDRAAVGDYDADGKSDIAVWRPSTGTWSIVLSSSSQTLTHQWGAAGDQPLVTDFDGDGRSELTVLRPATGVWYRLDLTDMSVAIGYMRYRGFIPVPADYDGDGKTDLAAYRTASSSWYTIGSIDQTLITYAFGQANTYPLPAAFQPK